MYTCNESVDENDACVKCLDKLQALQLQLDAERAMRRGQQRVIDCLNAKINEIKISQWENCSHLLNRSSEIEQCMKTLSLQLKQVICKFGNLSLDENVERDGCVYTWEIKNFKALYETCLLYTSPSPRDRG